MEDKRTYIEKIDSVAHWLPQHVLSDVYQRCNDWIVAGGKPNDHYIERQFEYAKRFLPEKVKNNF